MTGARSVTTSSSVTNSSTCIENVVATTFTAVAVAANTLNRTKQQQLQSKCRHVRAIAVAATANMLNLYMEQPRTATAALQQMVAATKHSSVEPASPTRFAFTGAAPCFAARYS